MRTGRAFHTCAKIVVGTRVLGGQRDYAAIAIGGVTGPQGNRTILNSVEVLDDINNSWRPGPDFPIPIRSAAAIGDLSLGVLVLGGTTDGDNPLATIYRLPMIDGRSIWTRLSAKLSRPRYNHFALRVSSKFAACGNPGKKSIHARLLNFFGPLDLHGTTRTYLFVFHHELFVPISTL